MLFAAGESVLLLLFLLGLVNPEEIARDASEFLRGGGGDGRSPPPSCLLDLLSGGRVVVSGRPWLVIGNPCVGHRGGIVGEGGDYREACDKEGATQSALDFGGGSGNEEAGADALGRYVERSRAVDLGEGGVEKKKWVVAARSYLDGDGDGGSDGRSGSLSTTAMTGTTTLVFEQRFVDPLEGTAFPAASVQESARQGLASRFPVLSPWGGDDDDGDDGGDDGVVFGALRYSGNFMARSRVERWGRGSALSPQDDALDSGPVVLFTSECAVVLSFASAFMSSGTIYDTESDGLSFGVLGSVDSIPKGHSVSVMLSSYPLGDGPDGVRQALASWGRKLMALYGTDRPIHDVTLRNLQLSTDNGAFYYYNTEGGMNYQDTIEHVKRVADERGIPFRQWLMDSWWYYKGAGNGVKNWTAMQSVFPDGIAHVRDATGWDVVAHNRYFASDTDYARQNGGEYDFVIEGNKAIPTDYRFWHDLFRDAKLWGLTTYEQDWLFTTFNNLNYTLRSVSAGRRWLVQMSDAASRAGVSVQYCMPTPRFLLQTVEADAVTQVRASDDYFPGFDGNWRELGLASMLIGALGLTPTKDNFRTYPGRQGETRYSNATEHAPRLHGAVSSLSRGPVAPSDRIDLMDAELVLRSCDRAGRLLRPDAPAARTDAALLNEAGIILPSGGSRNVRGRRRLQQRQRGEVWSTWSSLSEVRFTYILAAGGPAFRFDERDVYASDDASSLVGDRYIAWDIDRTFTPLSLPVLVPPTNSTNFRLYGVVPIFSNGWALLGEAESKWIAVSGDRFSRLVLKEHGGFTVTITGDPGEDVRVILRSPDGSFHRVMCTVPSAGTAVLSSELMSCSNHSSLLESETWSVVDG